MEINEEYIWPCPKCKEPMEIVPLTRTKDNRKGVCVTCWCKYQKVYFEEE